jgi:hypothetical protein
MEDIGVCQGMVFFSLLNPSRPQDTFSITKSLKISSLKRQQREQEMREAFHTPHPRNTFFNCSLSVKNIKITSWHQRERERQSLKRKEEST